MLFRHNTGCSVFSARKVIIHISKRKKWRQRKCLGNLPCLPASQWWGQAVNSGLSPKSLNSLTSGQNHFVQSPVLKLVLTQEWKDTGLRIGRNRLCPKAPGGLGQVSALSGRAVHIYKGRDGAGLCLTVATSGCMMCTRAGTTSASPVLPGPAVALGSEGTSVNSLTVGRKGACVVGLGVGGLQAPGLLLVGLEAAFLVIRSPSCPGLGSLKEEILGNPSQPHWGICSLRCHSTEDLLLLTFIGSSERSELGAC